MSHQLTAIIDTVMPVPVEGPQGPPGNAATIEAGTTTTGAPGTDAEVTNSGTSSAAVFDFVIPRGDKGEPGDPASNYVTTVFGRQGDVVAQEGDYTWVQIAGKPSLFPPEAHQHDWSDILNEPAAFPPSAHTHVVAEVTGAVPDTRQILAGSGLTGGGPLSGDVTLTANLITVFGRSGAVVAVSGDYTAAMVTNAVDATQSYHDPSWLTGLAWSKISGTPSSFPPGPHTHDWADIINEPAAFPPAAHTHAAADVTSGVFVQARLGTGTPDGTNFLRGDGTWAVPPAGGGGGAVDSVFGRAGAVVAMTGDYTAAQVTNAVSTAGSYADPAWITSYGYGKLTGVPSTFPPSAHSHAWTEITGKPATFPPSAHGHDWSEISNKPSVASYQTPWLQNIDGGTFALTSVSQIGINDGLSGWSLNVRNRAPGLENTAGAIRYLLGLGCSNGNNDRLETTISRDSAGSFWDTCSWKLQRVVDSSPMSYMRFATTDQITLGGSAGVHFTADSSGIGLHRCASFFFNSGTGWGGANALIRGVNCRISFEWPGIASQLGMDSGGTIRTYDNPGTGYAPFACAALACAGITATGNVIAPNLIRHGESPVGVTDIASNNASAPGWNAAALTIRETNRLNTNPAGDNTGNNNAYMPRISFHWAYRGTGQIGMDYNGRIVALDGAGNLGPFAAGSYNGLAIQADNATPGANQILRTSGDGITRLGQVSASTHIGTSGFMYSQIYNMAYPEENNGIGWVNYIGTSNDGFIRRCTYAHFCNSINMVTKDQTNLSFQVYNYQQAVENPYGVVRIYSARGTSGSAALMILGGASATEIFRVGGDGQCGVWLGGRLRTLTVDGSGFVKAP